MNTNDKTPDIATLDLLRQTASSDMNKAMAAQFELAKAIELPLRQGMLVGDIVRGLFEANVLQPGATPEYPLDLLSPGSEAEHVAYTMPNQGRIPQRSVEGDYVMVPTYRIANAIDWLLKYAESANWNIVKRAMAVFEAGFVKKINDDGMHTLLAGATDRNIMIYDADASNGQLTKRLISMGKTTMTRNGGGNSSSINRRKLTDVMLSPEGLEGVRNWGIDQLDEISRREIYIAGDGSSSLTRVFGVNLHDIVELGEGQEYQSFFTAQLGGALNGTDVELALGLDLSKNDSFVMPIRKEVEVYPDQYLHREGREGYYGYAELGFACLDSRDTILFSF